MTVRYSGSYRPSQQQWRRPWALLPAPVQRAAVSGWGVLPTGVRRLLAPLGDVINPGHRTSSEPTEGPDTVPGVTAVRAEGFTPVEQLTGRMDISVAWPDDHKRSVVETRPWWVDEQIDGRLWLVRSPWPALTVNEALTVLWSTVEAPGEEFLNADGPTQLATMASVLRWPQAKATRQLASARQAGPAGEAHL